MKQNIRIFAVILISLLVISLPICFAQEINEEQKIKNEQQPIPASYYYTFPGLAAWLVEILFGAGFTYVAIGVAVIAGGYVVYRVSEYAWTYYTVYKYSKWYDHHAYRDHIINEYDFENIWGKKKPTQSKFENECKKTINSKSSNILKFVQKSNGRFIAYDTLTKMVVVGETNGKTIVTCYKDTRGELQKNTKGSNPNWIKTK